jgi:hypothetical protein
VRPEEVLKVHILICYDNILGGKGRPARKADNLGTLSGAYKGYNVA